MKLSVVIPTMNKRALLARTLDALLAQEPGTDDWDVVVVNDGSTDDTAEFLAAQEKRHPRLQVVSPPQNVGRARARNLGWRAATGQWVLFLDDDILAPSGLLRAHLDVLQTDPLAGTIGPAVTAPDIVDAPHFQYIDTRGVAKLPAGPAPGKYFVTQNAAAPRAALDAAGGFDEGYSAYGFEDMDLGFCLEDVGVDFHCLPRPVPHHIHHHTLADYLEKKRLCGQSSLKRLARRHPHRLREMRLHLLTDGPGERASTATRLLRAALRGWPGSLAMALASRWPADGARPLAPALHARCLDAAVMTCFARGLSDPEGRD